ncbi:MAG TPA: hypothetical protein VGI59_09520 [Candidatus Udaeobacter sp.]|jgi:hypothetical protein
MRYSVITASTPQRLVDETGAGIYVRIPALFDQMLRAGWIKPAVHKRKIKLFDLEDLDKCVERLKSGEIPG